LPVCGSGCWELGASDTDVHYKPKPTHSSTPVSVAPTAQQKKGKNAQQKKLEENKERKGTRAKKKTRTGTQ
jgi:hypothetical protein